jgi:dienelactone hydrolase
VLSPDYFHKSELTTDMKAPGFSLPTWIAQWRTTIQDADGVDVQKTSLLVKEWIGEMKRLFGREDSRYGIVGYCFGAPYVIDYCESRPSACRMMRSADMTVFT